MLLRYHARRFLFQKEKKRLEVSGGWRKRTRVGQVSPYSFPILNTFKKKEHFLGHLRHNNGDSSVI